jgi:hypothetical protein
MNDLCKFQSRFVHNCRQSSRLDLDYNSFIHASADFFPDLFHCKFVKSISRSPDRLLGLTTRIAARVNV